MFPGYLQLAGNKTASMINKGMKKPWWTPDSYKSFNRSLRHLRVQSLDVPFGILMYLFEHQMWVKEAKANMGLGILKPYFIFVFRNGLYIL